MLHGSNTGGHYEPYSPVFEIFEQVLLSDAGRADACTGYERDRRDEQRLEPDDEHCGANGPRGDCSAVGDRWDAEGPGCHGHEAAFDADLCCLINEGDAAVSGGGEFQPADTDEQIAEYGASEKTCRSAEARDALLEPKRAVERRAIAAVELRDEWLFSRRT